MKVDLRSFFIIVRGSTIKCSTMIKIVAKVDSVDFSVTPKSIRGTGVPTKTAGILFLNNGLPLKEK